MTAAAASPMQRGRRPPGKLGVYAPWPLVGVAVLLVALIVFTPVLVSNSHQPGVGILTQAELVVDKIAGNGTFDFYVWALGEEIRYSDISVGVATSFNWTGTTLVPWSTLNWTEWHNASNVLAMIVSTPANPVALNIYVHYVSPSGSTWYIGVLAFYVTVTSPPSGESLYSASATSGIAVASQQPVDNAHLPVDISLHNAGPGGGP